MRASLQGWINDADSARHLSHFSIAQIPIQLARISNRPEDYYISLVGELFRCINLPDCSSSDWAQLGNAFLQFSSETSNARLGRYGVSREDAALFSAASFYFGDFPASACLSMRNSTRPDDNEGLRAACFDFLARPQVLESQVAQELQNLLKAGAIEQLNDNVERSVVAAREALLEGPERWIAATLLSKILIRFRQSNLRAVLPDGGADFWSPLVHSLVDRQPSTWEFFPSQIEAIQGGLLANAESYALQMPTGAGKTTLCETLLYWHLKRHLADVAIMLVPYRSLASELRATLVRRLNAMGLPSRCAYGGTVPTGDEVHGLDQIRAVVATPEALSGILGADPAFAQRISLVICDEGHLLDSEGRGIGLELLLARLKARQARPTRFVFMSAIVPNIEEINAWLGGSNQTVIRSTYRPAIAEFAVLHPTGSGAAMSVSLDMHPHEPLERQFGIHGFLSRESFLFLNPGTGRTNTYPFTSIKTQAVAAARKVLSMGATAIFAANKRGSQGAIGIAEALVDQLQRPLPLPLPIDFARLDSLLKCIAYLEVEYGAEWIGTKSVRQGAVLHHGDIPQESREVLEGLIRDGDVRLVICTSTLAEGVNLPIRTLVLYSVQRRSLAGTTDMLARDIKNLVGRAGRAGANTKGLVICANPEQWPLVKPVASSGTGEDVTGSLRRLIEAISKYLATHSQALSNEFLEQYTVIHPLIDGVDATLIDLITQEIGEAEFVRIATELAAQTFAAHQLPEGSAGTLRLVFELRARRLIALRLGGKIAWARDTGAKVRLIDSVEQRLLPARPSWQDAVDSLADELRSVVLEWAWTHPELREDVGEAFRLRDGQTAEDVKRPFFEVVRLWMNGATFFQIAQQTQLSMDDLLAVHTRAVTYALQSLVEQGISLLARRLQADGIEIAEGVTNFTEQLRFGAPNLAARILATGGVRHRKAYVALGIALTRDGLATDAAATKANALESLRQYSGQWGEALGELIYANTLVDLANH